MHVASYSTHTLFFTWMLTCTISVKVLTENRWPTKSESFESSLVNGLCVKVWTWRRENAGVVQSLGPATVSDGTVTRCEQHSQLRHPREEAWHKQALLALTLPLCSPYSTRGLGGMGRKARRESGGMTPAHVLSPSSALHSFHLTVYLSI